MRPLFCNSTLILLRVASLLLLAMASAATAAETAVSLAGTWQFQLDRNDVGIRERWFARSLPQKIQLPGSLQEQGYGDDISTNTLWTGSINERSWFTAERYAPYRESGQVKVPFWLQPDKGYVGVAWYQRAITIPDTWRGQRIVVRLERAHWETTLWLDEQKIGARDSLGTPHEYDLGLTATPGQHQLTLRVDNRVRIPVGDDAHSVSDHTQGNWNGVAGRLELVATLPLWFADVRVFPDAARRQARVLVEVRNAQGSAGSGTIQATVRALNAASPSAPSSMAVPVQWTAQGGQVEFTSDLGPNAPLWDEFNPALHEITLELPGLAAPRGVVFGLRDVSTADKQIVVNGRKIFLRGTLECCIFPQHGYPPTDVGSWKRILTMARAHGLNHLRFHSWCPPEAAFEAADELGFYFQVECSAWSAEFNKGTALDGWIYDESERIVAANGNHPSFLLMVASNEPGGPEYEKFLARFVEYWQRKDPRRLYAAGSGWPSVTQNDFDVTADSRAYPVHAAPNGRNDGDYRAFLARRARPVVSHEIGQYCVFPNLDETTKYKGLLKAKNFEIVRDFMAAAGLSPQASDFLRASGRLQALFYKDEIEACLRTPGWAGFQLLDLHDFPGQGTALVGVLDAFWEEKGYITPSEYRRFCDETVPLARLASRVWTSDQTFRAKLDVAHFGQRALADAAFHWQIREVGGSIIREGTLPARTVSTGQVTPLGDIELPLLGFQQATALNLEVTLAGTRFANDWNFWVYPASGTSAVSPPNVTVVRELDATAEAALTNGARVVLLAEPRRIAGKTLGRFDPIFWNKLWFPSQPQHTLGLLVDPKHPALAQFPTSFHSDWQWQDLQNNSKPMVLDRLPKGLRPLVQVIDDWNTCRKLGLVLEARVGAGRLLVCGIDLDRDLPHRPAARQLRASLLAYAASEQFQPAVPAEVADLRTLFRELTPLEKVGAKVRSVDSEQEGYPGRHVLDGDPQTLWHTAWGDRAPSFPHELVIEFDSPALMAGITALPRQDGNRNGWIKGYEVFASINGKEWGPACAQGEFPAKDSLQTLRFNPPLSARFIKFRALSGHANGPWASLAEFGVLVTESK